MSKCLTCHTGDLEPGHTTVTLTKADRILVFRHVPARVCDCCGDYVLTLDLTEQLLQEAREADRRGVKMEVIDWQVAA